MLFHKNLYTKTKKVTVEMKPETQLQPEQKRIPLTMPHFVNCRENIYSLNESF